MNTCDAKWATELTFSSPAYTEAMESVALWRQVREVLRRVRKACLQGECDAWVPSLRGCHPYLRPVLETLGFEIGVSMSTGDRIQWGFSKYDEPMGRARATPIPLPETLPLELP